MSFTIRNKYYGFVNDLTKKMPMDDAIFFDELTKEGFFDIGNLREDVKAQAAESKQAECFLKKAIFPYMNEKDEDVDLKPLYKLLNVMERFGGPAKTLAQKIKVAIPLTEDGGTGDGQTGGDHDDVKINDCTRVLGKIQQQYTNLNQLDVDALLPALFARGVITLDDKKTIEDIKGRGKRMEYLVDEIIIRDLKTGRLVKFKGFLEVMEKSGNSTTQDVGGRLGSSTDFP